jgi:hypothetical protein
MPKKPAEPDSDPEADEPDAAKHEHPAHDHKHKHDEHPTKAELEELRKHKHDEPVKPAPVEGEPTPAVIDKPPPGVAEKKEKPRMRMLW